jgi:hypothetical protein
LRFALNSAVPVVVREAPKSFYSVELRSLLRETPCRACLLVPSAEMIDSPTPSWPDPMEIAGSSPAMTGCSASTAGWLVLLTWPCTRYGTLQPPKAPSGDLRNPRRPELSGTRTGDAVTAGATARSSSLTVNPPRDRQPRPCSRPDRAHKPRSSWRDNAVAVLACPRRPRPARSPCARNDRPHRARAQGS